MIKRTFLATVTVVALSMTCASPAVADPTAPEGCTFDAGVITCHVDEPIRASITRPERVCLPGNPIMVITNTMTIHYLRTTTTWQGLYVNDHQRLLGTATSEWTDVQTYVSPLPDAPPCPV